MEMWNQKLIGTYLTTKTFIVFAIFKEIQYYFTNRFISVILLLYIYMNIILSWSIIFSNIILSFIIINILEVTYLPTYYN